MFLEKLFLRYCFSKRGILYLLHLHVSVSARAEGHVVFLPQVWRWPQLSVGNTDSCVLYASNKGCVCCLDLVRFCGETAVCKNQCLAFVAKVLWKANQLISLRSQNCLQCKLNYEKNTEKCFNYFKVACEKKCFFFQIYCLSVIKSEMICYTSEC